VNNKKKETVSTQEAIDTDFAKRVEQMKADMVAASAKNRVDVVPILDFTNRGIKPVFGFVDAKEKYESAPKVLET